MARLPHAYPFRFLDHEDATRPLEAAFTAGAAFQRSGRAPAWTLLEAMAQAAGLAAFSREDSGGMVLQVQRFRCPRPPYPGDRLALSAQVLQRMGPVVRVKVLARRGERLVARAVVTLREVSP
ncbi:MAG: hypothetical protein ACOYXN_10425 [Acidobacteriota bacterium]